MGPCGLCVGMLNFILILSSTAWVSDLVVYLMNKKALESHHHIATDIEITVHVALHSLLWNDHCSDSFLLLTDLLLQPM